MMKYLSFVNANIILKFATTCQKVHKTKKVGSEDNRKNKKVNPQKER